MHSPDFRDTKRDVVKTFARAAVVACFLGGGTAGLIHITKQASKPRLDPQPTSSIYNDYPRASFE